MNVINASALQLTQSDVPFKLSPSGFKYLGINVTKTLNSLFSANFSPLMSKIKLDLHRWGNLPLSLIGEINAIKMNIFPKFFFFKAIDNIISDFLWGGKPPRIRKSTLQRCKFNGGLSLPNFQMYYWAAHIQKFLYWNKAVDLPWCNLETHSCISCSLIAYLPLLFHPTSLAFQITKWFSPPSRFGISLGDTLNVSQLLL